MRKDIASVFAAVSIAALTAATTLSVAQTAPAPSTKAKAPAKKASAKASAGQGEEGEQAAAPKKRDPAEAQRQIDTGIKLLQDGKAEPAIQMLTAATSGGGLPPQQMGRALYHRGIAYRKAGKPAQAISDLTSALWLKNGLTDADRADALKQRSEAYREAGLPDQTDSEGKVAGAKAARTAAAAPADQAKAATPAPAASTNFLAGLFGGNKTPLAPPAAEAPAKPAAAPPAAAPKSEAQTSGWSSQTRPAKTAEPVKAATMTAPVQPAPEAEPAPAAKSRQRTAAASPAPAPAAAAPAAAITAKPDGKFRARVALVRTRADAEAIVARLRVQHAGAIGNAATEINEASFGNMGTFFQVRVGPFAREADASGVCAKLKGSGLDCVPVDR